MIKKGTAVWKGGIKDGGGLISTETGVLRDTPYGFKSRFEGGPGTNPEELLGAAHAACFSMALAGKLGEAGMTAQKIETTAAVTLEKKAGSFLITASHLSLVATIPGADRVKFEAIANIAKSDCPVSRLFNASVTLEMQLVG